ncbi:MAG: roadblock/LC7 domain-containing protein [Longimicrobiales bacterium]
MTARYTDALEKLSRVRGVAGALVVEAKAGVPVAADVAAGVDSGAVAALASALYRGASRGMQTGGYEALRTLQLEATAGHVVVAGAGEMLVIAVAERDAQLGLVRLETQRAAESLQ